MATRHRHRASCARACAWLLVVACCAIGAARASAQLPGLPAEPPPPPPSEPFFDDSVVHDIQLWINAADWAKLQANYLDNTYYPCRFSWRGQVVQNVGIRSRGSGSRNARKPGLRVDFDHYSTTQEFLGLKSVVLDNLAQDASGLKERLAMKLLARVGIPAPREAHARLFVNSKFLGVYAIVESIDKAFMRRLENLDADGFLFEYKWNDVWVFTPRGATFDVYAPLFRPQTHEKDPASVLYIPIEAFVRMVNTSTDFERALVEYLDPLEFLRYLAAEMFVAEWDGFTGYAGMNNFYMYKKPKKSEFKFIAWDRDNAFRAVDHPVLQGVFDNVLTRRLMEVPAWRAHYYAMLLDVERSADAREGEPAPDGTLPPTWLQLEVDRQHALIRAAMLQDTNAPFTKEEFQLATDALREFARDRGAFVIAEVTRLTAPPF